MRLITLTAALLLALAASSGVEAATYPAGFEEETLVDGLTRPTAVDWAPDGRMFVIEKDGVLKVVNPGETTAETVLDLRERVNSWWDRGLLGLAVDSSYESNGFVYLLYTYEVKPQTPDTDAHTVSQLLRLKLDDASGMVEQTAILGTHTSGPCPAPSDAVDCIPSDGWSHSIGTVRSDPDGTLWVGSGDAADFNVPEGTIFRTLDERSMAGKVLHVDREGRGLAGHRFCPGNANLNDVCTKVFALGFRNPFRFSLRPGKGPAVGDVGQNEWEEIDLLQSGRGYGWPCYEAAHRMEGYDAHPRCATEYAKEGTAAAHLPPVYEYSHDVAGKGGGAVVVGPTYSGGEYPAAYQGSLFFGDYVNGFVKRLTFGPGGTPTEHAFAGDWSGVDIEQSPAGELVYVSFGDGDSGTGSVERIAYSPGNARPNADADVSPTSGPAPLDVSFDGSGSSDPEDGLLTYDWDFGDGSSHATEAAVDHTYASAGVYTARLTVTDPGGKSDSLTVRIDVGNSPPEPVIDAPASYTGGETVALQGSADDPDSGPLPASALDWNVKLVHGSHVHVAGSFHGQTSIQFTAQDDHDSDSYYEVSLTATDEDGLSATAMVEIRPQLAPLRVDSVPPGAPVSYAGSPFTAPVALSSSVGFQAVVSAADRFERLGRSYEFTGWADGEPRLRVLRIPAGGAELTALYRELGGTPPGNEQPADEPPALTGPVIAFARSRGLDARHRRLRGTVSDSEGVGTVLAALGRRAPHGRCRWWSRRRGGPAPRARSCRRPAWLRARVRPRGGAYVWTVSLGARPVPAGVYRLMVRASDLEGSWSSDQRLSLRVGRRP
jgi:glucose/arabinose dehydrogenase